MSFISKLEFKPEFAGCVGAEEEHWTIGVRDGRLVGAAPLVFQVIDEGDIRPELPVHQIEVVTGICGSSAEITADLAEKRRTLRRLGKRFGFRTDTSPVPPHPDFQTIVYPKPRYLEITERMESHQLRAGWICGLHVHVGCNSLEQAIQLLNGLRGFLPMLMAMSAVRPYPSDNGFVGRASERFFLYSRMQPNLVPPHVENLEHFETFAHEQGFGEDPRKCWWAVRINPKGTVEVRIFDMQETPEHAGQLAALVLVLTRMILQGRVEPNAGESRDIGIRLVAGATDPGERQSYSALLEEVAVYARVHYHSEARQIRRLIKRVLA